MTQPSKTPYHDHLDVCAHCAAHPFDLCRVGLQALHDEAGIVELGAASLRAENDADDSL